MGGNQEGRWSDPTCCAVVPVLRSVRPGVRGSSMSPEPLLPEPPAGMDSAWTETWHKGLQ